MVKKTLLTNIFVTGLAGLIFFSGCSLKPKSYYGVIQHQRQIQQTPRVGQPMPKPTGDCYGRRVISYAHNENTEPDITKESCRNPIQYEFFISCQEGAPEERVASYIRGKLAIDKDGDNITDEIIHNLSIEDITPEKISKYAPGCP